MERRQAFLLILSAAFFGLLLYLINFFPKRNSQVTPVINNPLAPFSRDVSVILTGDVMLGRSVMITSLDLGDPAYPFRKVGQTLSEADIVFLNLENPVIEGCPRILGGFTFCADPKMIEGLTFSGVDVVTLANNHSANYGQDGVKETEKLLSEKGIESVGLGNLAIKKVKGITFGFLGFDFVFKSPKDSDFELAKASDSRVDVLIVGVHWGVEYKDKANANQRLWAKKLVELGADVVVGHHPHWVQDDEKIDGKPVYYSLGNFVFDQMWSEETKKGLAVRLTFRDGALIKEERLPTYISSWAQPEFTRE